jgi:hypothetical protein
MEIKDILAAAAKAVDDAQLEQEFRVAGFTKAVDLIAGPVGQSDPANMGRPAREAPARHTDAGAGKLDSIANKLELDAEDISEVYADENGELNIVISPWKLDAKKMAATKQIAVLVSAGRQGAGIDDWTAMEPIRRTADEFKRLDAPNFAKAMQGMGDTFRFTGSGSSLKVKLSRPGWEEAKALVKKLARG